MSGSGPLRRLERWLVSVGARLERDRYPRPEAGGEVAALRLIPSTPVARVVAVHGAGNDALYPQAALFRALVARGCEVFAFDLDGHGVESTTTFRLTAMEGAIASAVDQAERHRPELPLHLVGHSLGGSLVLHALTSSLPRVLSAVVLSAPLRVTLGLRTAVAELRGFLRPATFAQREHYGLWGTIPAAGPLRRRAYPFRRTEGGHGSFGYVEAVQALLERLDVERQAVDVRQPVLLVYGDRDRLVPLEQGERLARAIPHAELLRVAGGTHWSTALDPVAIDAAAEWIGAHSPVAA
jgi:alpha-beta hydrolase superfamily lysophospholipase